MFSTDGPTVAAVGEQEATAGLQLARRDQAHVERTRPASSTCGGGSATSGVSAGKGRMDLVPPAPPRSSGRCRRCPSSAPTARPWRARPRAPRSTPPSPNETRQSMVSAGASSPRHLGAEHDAPAGAPHRLDQPVANIARPVRGRGRACRIPAPVPTAAPGPARKRRAAPRAAHETQHLRERVGRRGGKELLRRSLRGEHVAAPAAADQDLAAAVRSALDEQRVRSRARGEERRHQNPPRRRRLRRHQRHADRAAPSTELVVDPAAGVQPHSRADEGEHERQPHRHRRASAHQPSHPPMVMPRIARSLRMAEREAGEQGGRGTEEQGSQYRGT